jgi:hypothetical protein
MNTGTHNMTNFEYATRQLWSWLRRLSIVLLAALLLSPAVLFALDTQCAKVKIEITQKLTMERQAFDAMMKINNGLTSTSLDNVSINVNFQDEAGNSIKATSDPNDTTASFFLRVDTMTGINNVSGSGVVAPATTAEIHWLIIPTPGAGGVIPSGKLYYIGASLDYAVGGKAERVDVSPDYVYVQPMPLLVLDYFMTQDVWGDDPLTPEVEPIEPYTLGVRIKNNGAGTANNVRIDSAQPRIVENRQGLLIKFELIGSYLNDQPTINSLLIPFGDIPSNSASNGRWLMTSSLMGHFTDFSVSFTHADALGGAATALIQATNPHFLIRDVKVDMPGRDNIRDFLALDGTVLRVYESSGVDTLVTNQSANATLTANGTNAGGEALFSLLSPVTAGPLYVQLHDPYNGTKAVGKMTRSDGKTILTENVWLSKKRDANNVLQYYFNLFDADSTGVYNIAFANTAAAAHPPVIQQVPDRSVTEGNQLSFLVTASDPDGTAPLLTSSLLPSGATFSTSVDANNIVTGIFDWTPGKGQAGKYPITFSASDGVLKTATSTNITVTTAIAPAGPDMPLIAAPEVGTEVNVRSPDLAVAASSNPLDTALSYHLQVYSDAGMLHLVVENPILARAATGNSIWTLPSLLLDNTWYYWRVRASDGTTYSAWSTGRFFVNSANDAPTVPLVATPSNGATVGVTTPVLSVTNSTDPENDAVVYGFEVYKDSLLQQKIAEVANLAAGFAGSTSWTVTPALFNNTQYFWRASATDIHGAKTMSTTASFRVDTAKSAPLAPVLLSPSAGSTVAAASVTLTVANSQHTADISLKYYFELGHTQNFAGPAILRSGGLQEGAVTTWFSAANLVENAHYYWRVKSTDGVTESLWTYGDFIVDTVNDAPGVPATINPGDKAWVTTTTPLFTLAPSVDPEGDAIAYRIEIYADASLTVKLTDTLTGNSSWLPSVALQDGMTYFWRVRAEDIRGGLSAWSPVSTFLVRTGSSGSMLPLLALTSPANLVEVPAPTVSMPKASVSITWEIDDPLNNSQVALYYSNDRLSTSGNLIINGLLQNPGSRLGSYSWDVSSLAPGTYYIYAQVSNNAGTVTRYAPGAFIVPVPAPRGVVTVTPITALETTEAGGQASFSVVLGNSPKADVSIGINTTKPTEGLVDLQQLVFNTANWNIPQTVTVTGQADCINDGDVSYQVITSKAISIDADYNGIKGADLTLVNRGSTAGCPSNNPPLADAGPAQQVNAGSAVTMSGSGVDSDGTIASYAWLQIAGTTVVLTDSAKAVASFTAPLSVTDTQLSFQLTVIDNLGASATATVNVFVKAVHFSPTVSLTSSSLTFASQNIGVASAAQTVTLTNSGTAALSITDIAASNDFVQTNNCGASVAAGANCTITIAFTPSSVGAISGTVTISSNASDSPSVIAMNGTGALALNFVPGWNLVGNSVDSNLDVAATLGDPGKVQTVWKWIPSSSKWAFYSPSLEGQALTDYATNKGYDVLSFVNAGEGFWVNAKTPFTASLPLGVAITSNHFADPNGLPHSWSLISVGDNPKPRDFANAIAQPASPNIAATSISTLWAWDSGLSAWYFYAPSLDNSGGLQYYITTKGYLDFAAKGKTLDPTTGFWVNHP